MQETFLLIVQMVFAALLIGVILLQQKGSGLGIAFGASSNMYSTKRGVDKFLFQSTIVLSILFFGTALMSVVL